VVALDPSNTALADAVAGATRGRMADVVFEVTGDPNLIASEFSVLKPHEGRVVMLSSPRGMSSFDFHDLCNWPSHTIIGAHNSSHPVHENRADPWTQMRNSELFLDLIADRELDLPAWITCHRLRRRII
jgi:threonine dehydrogenase-like Zn-dependent dehydrogenase